MRVITGKYKGRHFEIPRTFKARPTTDFAKENIFNVLMGYIDFDDSAALDLFAGTGSISLELLSRGCNPVVSVEADRDHYRFFADPPYALENLAELPQLVLDSNLLKEGGIFVLEHGKNNDFSSNKQFLEHRQYGSVNFSLFR